MPLKSKTAKSSPARAHSGGDRGYPEFGPGTPPWVRGSIYKKKVVQDRGPNTHPNTSKMGYPYGAVGGQNRKIPWGIIFCPKMMILPGVGHPIPQLRVCYANNPKNGGYTAPAPDLTTSLRGDFINHLTPQLQTPCKGSTKSRKMARSWACCNFNTLPLGPQLSCGSFLTPCVCASAVAVCREAHEKNLGIAQVQPECLIGCFVKFAGRRGLGIQRRLSLKPSPNRQSQTRTDQTRTMNKTDAACGAKMYLAPIEMRWFTYRWTTAGSQHCALGSTMEKSQGERPRVICAAEYG